MSCVHQLNLIPFPGGPGALFHEGQIGPSSLTHAASKALLSASRLSPRFIRLRSLVGKHLRQMAFFLRRHRDREENQTISQSWVCCSVHCFFLHGDDPRGRMRCNGKNLRPKLLDDTSSGS